MCLHPRSSQRRSLHLLTQRHLWTCQGHYISTSLISTFTLISLSSPLLFHLHPNLLFALSSFCLSLCHLSHLPYSHLSSTALSVIRLHLCHFSLPPSPLSPIPIFISSDHHHLCPTFITLSISSSTLPSSSLPISSPSTPSTQVHHLCHLHCLHLSAPISSSSTPSPALFSFLASPAIPLHCLPLTPPVFSKPENLLPRTPALNSTLQ